MRQRARVDRNHKAITDALRQMGCSVLSLASRGQGCPDLLVGVRGRNLLLEVKMPRGTLTPAQRTWREGWRGSVLYVRSVDEALEIAQAVAAGADRRI